MPSVHTGEGPRDPLGPRQCVQRASILPCMLYIHVCVYMVCTHIYMYTHTYTCVCIYGVYMGTYSMQGSMQGSMDVCHMYMCVYTCICVYIPYIDIHVYIAYKPVWMPSVHTGECPKGALWALCPFCMCTYMCTYSMQGSMVYIAICAHIARKAHIAIYTILPCMLCVHIYVHI